MDRENGPVTTEKSGHKLTVPNVHFLLNLILSLQGWANYIAKKNSNFSEDDKSENHIKI